MAAKRKASGRNVAESERSTVKVQLRLEPDDAEDLDQLAALWDVTRSSAVACAVADALAADQRRQRAAVRRAI